MTRYDVHGRYVYCVRRTGDERRIHAMTMVLAWDEGDPSIIGLDRGPVLRPESAAPAPDV